MGVGDAGRGAYQRPVASHELSALPTSHSTSYHRMSKSRAPTFSGQDGDSVVISSVWYYLTWIDLTRTWSGIACLLCQLLVTRSCISLGNRTSTYGHIWAACAAARISLQSWRLGSQQIHLAAKTWSPCCDRFSMDMWHTNTLKNPLKLQLPCPKSR